MSTPVPTGSAALMSLKVLVGALMGAIVFIAIALYFVLGTTDGVFDVTPLLLAPLVLGALSFVASNAVGYRAPAIEPGTDRDRAEVASRTAYQSGTILRFALSEFVAILGIAAAFVVTSGGYVLFLLAAVVSLVLMFFHCWPSERTFARTQAALESTGGESYLREAYGLPPATGGGAIQRL